MERSPCSRSIALSDDIAERCIILGCAREVGRYLKRDIASERTARKVLEEGWEFLEYRHLAADEGDVYGTIPLERIEQLAKLLADCRTGLGGFPACLTPMRATVSLDAELALVVAEHRHAPLEDENICSGLQVFNGSNIFVAHPGPSVRQDRSLPGTLYWTTNNAIS